MELLASVSLITTSSTESVRNALPELPMMEPNARALRSLTQRSNVDQTRLLSTINVSATLDFTLSMESASLVLLTLLSTVSTVFVDATLRNGA